MGDTLRSGGGKAVLMISHVLLCFIFYLIAGKKKMPSFVIRVGFCVFLSVTGGVCISLESKISVEQ